MYTMLGIQRSSFMNTLDELSERGYLDYNSSEIHIHDRNRMFELMAADE